MVNGRGPTLSLNQNLLAGALLVALGCFSVWLTRDLTQGSLSSMGAGFMPRYLGIAIAAIGGVLFALGIRSAKKDFQHISWRGLGLVLLAIVVFALTIRPFDLGFMTTPGLGLIVAGPLAVIISGYASPEAQIRELLLIAFSLTAFSILLFADILNLPLPVFPKVLAASFAGISAKLVLRCATGGLVVVALLALASLRKSTRKPPMSGSETAAGAEVSNV